jgi:hypothetical protein
LRILTFVVILFCAVGLRAQDAKVISLTPEDTAQAAQAYANLQKAQADWDTLQKTIEQKYTLVKLGDPDAENDEVNINPETGFTSPMFFGTSGWGCSNGGDSCMTPAERAIRAKQAAEEKVESDRDFGNYINNSRMKIKEICQMNDEQIKYMVDRFLEWRLPENFNPDAGISFKPNFNEHTAYPMKHEPVGTNLFDATQAEEMVRYLIDGMPTDELRKTLVGNPSVEEWAEWIVSRHNFCERNAGESLREISLVALRNVESR